MTKLIRRYRRLPWYVHTTVLVHLLALLCIPLYYTLRWYGPRQLTRNLNLTPPLTDEQLENLIESFEFDRTHIDPSGWVTFWYKGGLFGPTSEVGWQLRHPSRCIVRHTASPNTDRLTIENGKSSSWREEPGEEPHKELIK